MPGLRRLQTPGIPWDQLPNIDFVFITHNHYDHLDATVVKRLAPHKTTHFIVPDGLESWMHKKGVQRVSSMSWWDETVLPTPSGTIKLTCCPAQHGSARGLFDHNQTLWCGWNMEWEGRNIYHAGDTGYCPHFQEIGKRIDPIDLALLPIGAYDPRWLMKPVHITPEEALTIHCDIKAKRSIACHWGTFLLTDEPVMEPLQRLETAKKKQGISPEAFQHLPIGGMLTI
jgi:N-acyl-phosphatidylethanolamine-hydrolysing phospholipase D